MDTSLPRTRVARLVMVCLVASLVVTGCAIPRPDLRRPALIRAQPTESHRDGPDYPPPHHGSDPLPADLRARLPHFPPPPRPHRIAEPTNGLAGWFSNLPTGQPVAFLTIDDGWIKDPRAADLFRAAHVPVTLFLEINAISDDPDFFARLEAAGATIQAHTITHPELPGSSYAFQTREICGSADQLTTLYGHRPTLFRPPFGDKDITTLRVVHDCGMVAALMWRETVNAGVVRYQIGNQVQPGDIILMHFRTTFVEDFIAALQAIHAAGLTPARLEDYLT